MVINNYRQAKVEFDQRGICISMEEILFFAGFILWLVQFYISRTIFSDLFGDKLLTIARYFCMLIFFVKIVLAEKTFHKRAAAVFITVAAVFIAVQINVHTGMPLIQVLLLIYAARDISYRRICKVSFWTCLILWLIPVMMDRIGINELDKSIHNQRVREYLNFVFVTFSAIYFNNITYCALYAYTDPPRRGKGGSCAGQKTAPWPLIILLAAVNIWLYKVTDTSLPFAIVMLFIVLYVVTVKFRFPIIRNNLSGRIVALTIFPVTAFITYIVSKNYNSKIKWMSDLNSFTHKRLALSYQGIKQYGVHLLGTQIVENTDTTKGAYFYLDSGYIKNLIYYGLIFFVILLVFCTVILYAAVLENDRVLAIWMICIALYSMFNNLLLLPAENCTMFAIWYALGLLDWHRKKNRIKKVKRRRAKREQIEHAA